MSLPEVNWRPVRPDELPEHEAAHVRLHICGHRQRDPECYGCYLADDIVITAHQPAPLLADLPLKPCEGPHRAEIRTPLPVLR